MFGQTGHLLVISKDKEEVGNFKKLLTELLKEDMEFYSASGIEEALPVLSEHVIDLIFLDINIGRKQGFELMNAMPVFCRPPVIFIADQQSIDPELRGIEPLRLKQTKPQDLDVISAKLT